MEDAVHIEDGLVVFSREGIYQMRLKIAPQKYIYRTLKTRNKRDAVAKARKELWRAESRREEGSSYAVPTLKKVMAEYVAQREVDYQRGKVGVGMIRQIKRVQKFWLEFAGNNPIDKINDRELRDFVDWRVAYYGKIPEACRVALRTDP